MLSTLFIVLSQNSLAYRVPLICNILLESLPFWWTLFDPVVEFEEYVLFLFLLSYSHQYDFLDLTDQQSGTKQEIATVIHPVFKLISVPCLLVWSALGLKVYRTWCRLIISWISSQLIIILFFHNLYILCNFCLWFNWRLNFFWQCMQTFMLDYQSFKKLCLLQSYLYEMHTFFYKSKLLSWFKT